MKRMLSLFIFLLLISCYPNEARMIDDFYEVEESLENGVEPNGKMKTENMIFNIA